MHSPDPAIPLRQVLRTLGDSLLELAAAPRGVEVEVRDVVIVDPDDELERRAGSLVLIIGARGRAVVPLLRAAARYGAAAVAVKGEINTGLRDAAADAEVALLSVHPGAHWAQVAALTRGALDDARLTSGAESGELLGDLFSVAQTTATLTGGIVTIEDTASRVLAYSGSSGDASEVDELRRLSILGRQGPQEYLAMLREWGVFDRLRSGEQVVRIDERAELGIRARIAVGIFAGGTPLGSIWVQEGTEPLLQRAERALLGAARVAALQLVRRRSERNAESDLREGLLAGLLEGRVDAGAVTEEIGADKAKPATVVAFAFTAADAATDLPAHELRNAELTGLIAVHAAAYRRSALTTTIGSRVYVLLPDLPRQDATATVAGLAGEIVAASTRHAGATARAAVGSPNVPAHAADARRDADRVLDATGPGGLDVPVATIADVRSAVLLAEIGAAIRTSEHMQDPRLDTLAAHDRGHGGELARSLLAYLDAFGDVRGAAGRLGVHPNTLRYRVRRAEQVAGIDLGSPEDRIVAQLLLRARS